MDSSSSDTRVLRTAQTQSSCRCINVANFVSAKLGWDGKTNNYKSWKEQMLCLIESEGLLDFIDANISPPEKTSDEYVVWRRTDRQVKGWILGALSDKVVETFVTFETARDVWLQLEKAFTKPQGSPAPPSQPAGQGTDLSTNQGSDGQVYLPLYRATLKGDWDEAYTILQQHPAAAHSPIAVHSRTPLHIAVGTGKAIPFVQKLADRLNDDQLALRDGFGCNALHIAALNGNTAAARILIARLPNSLYVPNNEGNLPVHIAAVNAHRDALQFLISKTKDNVDPDGPDPFAGESGARLLTFTIDARFFDIAMDLADKYPHMARIKGPRGWALQRIAYKESAFYSGARFNFWERLIYRGLAWLEGDQHTVATGMHSATPNSGDMENPVCTALLRTVPCLREIHDKKMMHQQALQLVKCLCKHMEQLGDKEAKPIYIDPILIAAHLGIHEVIEVIVEKFPDAIYSLEAPTRGSIFHIAVKNRCEKVFNLVYRTSGLRHNFLLTLDAFGNTLLHLAARLAPPYKLNQASGAALQMQCELQWFKEVEKWLTPRFKEILNHARKTPNMIFTEEHKNLKVEGEKWMKDTANSCTISAALIATVVFAAAITVPGGNESDSGYPLFSHSTAFIIFAISVAVSLFTSTSSLLMFLSILTSRYAEEDFLYALPKRLCIGLVTLFVSISFMIVAFSATVFLVFGRKQSWVLMPVAAIACLPVASFVLLQFPLLVDVISSTYGRGIFGKQSDRPFH